jgi:non-ribosomal peptide synthetase component F
MKRAPDAALFNEYGPTEMTVWSTCHRLQKGDVDPISIGRPLAHTQALVVDEVGNIAPYGFSGELVLAGHGIAEGYMGGVSGGFTAHPLEPGSRAYKTGDRVRLGADGLLYFEGRVDAQVKFRGYRIGVESIEQALGGVAGEAAVIAWDGTSLEDLLAKLPNDEAHALVDQRLKAANVSAKD